MDTSWIFILPATLQVNYRLTAEYNGPSGHGTAEENGRNRTTFHALLFPLYPLFPPGAREHSLLQKMLWRSAADVYTKTNRGKTDQPTP